MIRPVPDLGDTLRLLREALGGEPASRELLLERLRPRIVLWCASRMSAALRARVEPEDAAQEVLVAVLRDFDRFRGDGPPSFFAWLWTVAEHRLTDLANYHAAEKRQPVADRLKGTQTSPSQAAARSEMIERLHRAIAQLPDDHRAALRLVKLEERPIVEAASVLGRSENAVRILYCRALQRLRELLASPA
jgi:RNA polymerase sigma-70 factor (ECF subfamily)